MKCLLVSLLIACSALAAQGAEVPVLDPPAPQVGVIGVDEVFRGQRGYGLSVFAGTVPERFEVEVIGVLRNLSPGTSLIMAKLSGQGLEQSGVIRGMSGSPVYLDGRLAGAVAYGWAFSREAIAGITPIGDMREIATSPPAAGRTGSSGRSGRAPALSFEQLTSLSWPADLLTTELARLVQRPALGLGSSPLLFAGSGFGERSSALLADALGGVGAAGSGLGPAGSPQGGGAGPQPGGVVGAVLVGGDLQLAAMGTVTDCYGDTVLAFGHPFVGSGSLNLPMALGEVVTVVPTMDSSFKLTNLGPVVGAIEQDRRPGLVGRMGGEAPTVPVVIRLRGEAPREFRVFLATDLTEYLPSLLATSVFGAVDVVGKQRGDQQVDLSARFLVAGHGEVRVAQSFAGERSALDSVSFLLGVADQLLNHGLADVALEAVEVEVELAEGARLVAVTGAHADRARARPGDRLRLTVDLRSPEGESRRESVELTLPSELPEGRYTLLVGDGASVRTARLGLEPQRPRSVPEVLELLRTLRSRRELLVLGVVPGRGLAFDGRPMPQLPGTARSLLAPESTPLPRNVGLRSAVAQEVTKPLDTPVSGLARVEILIDREGKGTR
ncbi:MAG TPA: hypothetical protein VF017_21115 [Thermoanaerobaculia bacterium]|nr:hypothetical protein [Thermoanaerobaculia bacterium]